MAEEKDFEIWGCQFIDAMVSHIQIGGVDIADQTLLRMPSMTCPTASASWHFTCQLLHGFLLVTS
jgi:hypothetical protein